MENDVGGTPGMNECLSGFCLPLEVEEGGSRYNGNPNMDKCLDLCYSNWDTTSFQRWTLSTAVTSHNYGNLIAQGLESL